MLGDQSGLLQQNQGRREEMDLADWVGSKVLSHNTERSQLDSRVEVALNIYQVSNVVRLRRFL